MPRRALRQLLILVALGMLLVPLVSGCKGRLPTEVRVEGSTATKALAACPAGSCFTKTGYGQCIAAGCGCDPRTDLCVIKTVPTPIPATSDIAGF